MTLAWDSASVILHLYGYGMRVVTIEIPENPQMSRVSAYAHAMQFPNGSVQAATGAVSRGGRW